MRDVESILMRHLRADPELSKLVGVRIFPLVRPEKDDSPEQLHKLPAIVYQRISTGYARSHDLESEDLGDASIQYSVFAETRREAREVAGHLRRLLRRFREYAQGIQSVRIDQILEQYEQDTGIYQVVLTVSVRYLED